MLWKNVLLGAAAGAAGTTALNTATYVDMVVRGRPASTTPEGTVEKLADLVGADVPGSPDAAKARTSGLGALTGIAAGLGVGAVLGGVRAGGRLGLLGGSLTAGLLAMLAGDGPMVALGVVDPRNWGVKGWVADVGPHAAYGLVTWAILHRLAARSPK